MFEYQVEAKINQSFVDGGAETLAYTSIIAAGNNATVLRYVSNRDKMNDGDLLLIDAGGEMNCYASDITRTFPVNGKFTAPQKRVYDIVLQAQLAAIAVAKPGIQYSEMHRRATEVLVEGLLDLGILKGNRDDIIRAKTHMKFYPHGTGHWLGLDVHDSGTYFTDDGNSILLEPGHVMTVEPGLYFTKEDQSVPEEYRGIGIRIEDDVLITEKGNEIMTADVVKETRDIENLMGR
jgi:Xaa-Pro aminopeptidase